MNVLPVVVDYETYYAHDYSLSKMSTESYIRDDRFKVHGAGIKVNGGPSVWVPAHLLQKVFDRMPWERIMLIGHELHFDGTITNWIYGKKPYLYCDTLGMSRAILGQHNARHGLGHAAPVLIGQHKMEGLAQTMGCRDLSPKQMAELIDYCIGVARWNPNKQRTEAGDTELTWGIFKKMLPLFPRKEFKVLDWCIRQFAQPTLYLDTVKLESYIGEVQDQKRIAIEDVYYQQQFGQLAYYVHHESGCVFRDAPDREQDGLAEQISREMYLELRADGYAADRLTDVQHEEGRKILASADKYAAALEALGVTPPTKINKKGKVTFAFAKTDDEHKALLEYDYADEHTNAQVQALVAARLEVKSTIEETRAIKYHDASTRGEWPVDYNYCGAKNTHRISGGKGGGGNPTNLKRGGTLRDCIYPAEGKKLLVADLSQIECRIILWLGSKMPRANGELEALEIMRKGGDLYSYFASLMYGYEVLKHSHPFERQIGKSAVLGLGFGMGVARFIDYCLTSGIRIQPVLAESAVNLYRNRFSGVKQYWMVLDKSMKSAVYDGVGSIQYPVGLPGLPISKIVREPLFGHVSLQSPSGLLLKYPDLCWDAEGEGTYRDGNSRVKIFGGKFAENETQHLARNVLFDKLLEVDDQYPVRMSTYDEIVCEIDDDPEVEQIATEFIQGVMTRPHPDFPGLPLGVEIGTGYTYGSAKH